jgi:hypothetical protein
MMRRFSAFAIFTVLLFAAATAQAKPHEMQQPSFSGHELFQMCGSTYDTDYGYCAGYVAAVANTMLSESVAGYRACNFGAARPQQFVDIFKRYGANYNDSLQGEANTAVAAALARAFPCVQ